MIAAVQEAVGKRLAAALESHQGRRGVVLRVGGPRTRAINACSSAGSISSAAELPNNHDGIKHMNALPLLAPPNNNQQTLDDLVTRLELAENINNEDAVVGLSTLRMTNEGTLEVPGLDGAFAMNEWARGQFARLVGVALGIAGSKAPTPKSAPTKSTSASLVRREWFAFDPSRTCPRTSPPTGPSAHSCRPSTARSPTPIVARTLKDALVGIEDHARVVRRSTTEKTTTFVIRVGERLTPNAEVGDLEGCIVVRNSGVGYARLMVGLLLHRLVCKNGLILSLPGSTLVRAIHRGIDSQRVAEQLVDGLVDLPLKLYRGARAMAAATNIEVDNVELELRDVLREARLPMRLVNPVMAAYAREPRSTRFGVSQALTLAAQSETPEVRHELERVAGQYLASA